MLEIRIHGRGGQGNVVAAYLLASAAIEQGQYAQAFPSFGAERRGAPVSAFVRIHSQPIQRRCQILAPDYLIIQDDALLQVSGVLDGLKPQGGALINSTQTATVLAQATGVNIIPLAATQLAQTWLGRPVPNTALLAAFLTLTQILPLTALESVLAKRFKGKVLEQNIQLIHQAAQAVAALSLSWSTPHVASA